MCHPETEMPALNTFLPLPRNIPECRRCKRRCDHLTVPFASHPVEDDSPEPHRRVERGKSQHLRIDTA